MCNPLDLMFVGLSLMCGVEAEVFLIQWEYNRIERLTDKHGEGKADEGFALDNEIIIMFDVCL